VNTTAARVPPLQCDGTQLARVVVRNALWSGAGQAAIKVLSFGFSVLVIRQLGVEAFGQYSGVLAFGAMFVFLADLGLSPLAVRQVAQWRAEEDPEHRTGGLLGNLLALRFLLSLLTASLLVMTSVLTQRTPEMVAAIALGAVGLIVYSAHGACDAVLSGWERFDLSTRAMVVNQLAFVAAGAAALWLGFSYFGLLVANLLGVALMTVLCWRAVRQLSITPGRPNVSSWLGLVRAGIPFGIIGLTLGLSYKFDSVLLNIFRSDAETGYYNAAYNLVFSAMLISHVINTALYPSLTRQAARDPASLPNACGRALRLLLTIGLPIAVGTFVAADRIVPFLFTEAYGPAVPALQIVMWSSPMMFTSELLGYVAAIQAQEKRVARAVIASTVVNVALNLIVVPRFGYLGAAVVTVLTEVVLVSQCVWMVRPVIQQLEWQQVFGKPFLAAVLMGLFMWQLSDLPVLPCVALGAVLYGALLLVLGVFPADELAFARRFGARVAGLT
jgi:O-antigen/teichoic acid export membrane protein